MKFWQVSAAVGGIAALLSLGFGALHDAEVRGEQLVLDSKLSQAIAEKYEPDLNSFGIKRVVLTCGKKLRGAFTLAPAAVDESFKVTSKAACTDAGVLLEIVRDYPSVKVRAQQPYETELVVNEIDAMLTSQFGSLRFRKDLTDEFDQVQRDALLASRVARIRFYCKDSKTFLYDMTSEGNLLKGETKIDCPAQTDGGESPQLRLALLPQETKGAYTVMATKNITAESVKQLVAAAQGDERRKKSF